MNPQLEKHRITTKANIIRNDGFSGISQPSKRKCLLVPVEKRDAKTLMNFMYYVSMWTLPVTWRWWATAGQHTSLSHRKTKFYFFMHHKILLWCIKNNLWMPQRNTQNLLNLSGPNSRPGSVIWIDSEMIIMKNKSMNYSCFNTTSVESTEITFSVSSSVKYVDISSCKLMYNLICLIIYSWVAINVFFLFPVVI